MRSRLTKRVERKTRKNLYLSLLGIFLFLFALVKFGIPLLANFSIIISGNSKEEIPIENSNSFVAPPTLNSLPTATNSASLEITGVSFPDQSISLFINGSLIDKTLTQKDGSFSFKQTLSPGENDIKVKATVSNKDSSFSPAQTVIYKSSNPALRIDFPPDGQSFSKDQNRIEVKGSTDSEVKVTINDFWAIVDENNNYSYTLLLKNGENIIKIKATDLAGNITEKEIKVNYSP